MGGPFVAFFDYLRGQHAYYADRDTFGPERI